MSEEKKDEKDAKDAKPAGDDAAAAKAPAKGGPPFVLIGVIAGALVAGAALGTFLVAPRVNAARHTAAVKAAMQPEHGKGKKHKKDDKEKGGKEKHGEAGKSPVYKLDNIIVNPAGSQGQRFLMCSVAIESEDSKALDTLREHEIELRDRVVTLLSQQTLDRLTDQAARDSIRTSLLHVITPVLGDEAEDADLKVYLPQFVVQ